jgi:signal transduction histidine kinase
MVNVKLESKKDTVIVSITDTGIGISEEMLHKVFELFTQVDTSFERSQGGLGIGLTLVRELVEMHAGTIKAESPGFNKGSTFTVTFPRYIEDCF